MLSLIGVQDFAPSIFEHNESVLNAGVLFSLPALMAQGLNTFFKVLSPLSAGYYGLQHIILTLCFMALCRIKNPEQLKQYAPGELGKLLGLDRVPEVGTFRKKLQQIIQQSKADAIHQALFHSWVEDMPESFFYIDGHVRVYHGHQANLPKRFVSREKLCLSGTTEFWVNDQSGLPLMVITSELNSKLKEAVEEIIPKILQEFPSKNESSTEPVFVLVMDRECYEPAWFKKLWDDHKIAVITYRKNVKDKWEKNLFKPFTVKVFEEGVTMLLCEQETELNGHCFREVRKCSADNHQTAIITTHPSLAIELIARKMFARWTQENFFKYLIDNFDFDRMIEYGTEPVKQCSEIVNPAYRQLSYQIKKAKEKKQRLDAKLLNKLEAQEKETIHQAMKIIAQSSELVEQINQYKIDIDLLITKRKAIPARITIEQMPQEKRYNKLKQEGKKIKNAIIMLAYRAESALFNAMREFYKYTDKEGRIIVNEIFTNEADIIPDYQNKTLTIKLHSLSTPRANDAVKKICQLLNETETIYPYSELRLVYKTVAG